MAYKECHQYQIQDNAVSIPPDLSHCGNRGCRDCDYVSTEIWNIMDKLFMYTWVPVKNLHTKEASNWLEANIGPEGKKWYTTSSINGWPITGWMIESEEDALMFRLTFGL